MKEFNQGILYAFSAGLKARGCDGLATLLDEVIATEQEEKHNNHSAPGTERRSCRGAIREYCLLLRREDPEIGAVPLIRMAIEHFGISQNEMARILGLNSGWLSDYLREGKRRRTVMAALAALAGDDCGTARED